MNLEAWLEIIRPVNVLMTGIGVAVGYFLASLGFPVTENLGLAMLSAMIIAGAGMSINDYFDRYIDARIKPERPIPSGRIRSWQAVLVSVILFSIGIAISNEINEMTLIISLVASLLLILYSWLFARTPLVGNTIIAINTGLTFIFGEAAATNSVFSLNTTILFTLAFLSTLAREIYKDIEDIEGDRISRRTLPMITGKNWSRLLAGSLVLISVIASPVPYIMGTLNINYIIAVGIADLIFIYVAFASILKDKEYTRELKIAQLFALVAFLIGMST